MQAFYPAAFDREFGCTEAEWLMWLPAALGDPSARIHQGSAQVPVGDGTLSLAWERLPPREIALVRLPRLAVSFRFDGVDEARRQTFMRRFDLYMQRGGG